MTTARSGDLAGHHRLIGTAYDKVWGSLRTDPWYRNSESRPIGEIWFPASDAVPLLVKFLFTSDKLSVQVHPGDEWAREHHGCRGKTEMWHILRADAGAKIAIGLRERVTRERLEAASRSGEIMDLLNWVPVQPGDTFFIPAGTIHAIGENIVLCEVQQQSDVTYRLYDYDRGRELHLDDGVAVSFLGPHGPVATSELPVKCHYFHTSRLNVKGTVRCPSAERDTRYIALEGEGLFAGQPFRAGDAWEVERNAGVFEIESPNAAFLVTAEPPTEP
jgi:mannose-6-phosphate isomerase